MNETLSSSVRALLHRLHGQRPLRGGSLIVTLFGDAIAPRGGVVTLRSLIRIAKPFRLTERLVRTSVARLANEDWLVARRDGRQSEYRLTSGGEQRFAEATRRIYSAAPASWNGAWTLLILPAARRAKREPVRDELRWLGFGQLSPDTFAHPNCTLEQVKLWLKDLSGAQDALSLTSSTGSVAVDRRLVRIGWDLGDLTRRYRRFLKTFEPIESAVANSMSIDSQEALIVRTLLIHEYRKIHLQDPLLPPALLPPDWVGTAAYELTRRLYSQVFEAAEGFLSATASTVSEPLPSANPSTYLRFGGLSPVLSRPVPRRG